MKHRQTLLANESMPRWRFRIRFTLRTLLVAIVAIAVGLESWKRAEKRADGLKRMAAEHARKAQEYADAAWGIQRLGGFHPEYDTQARRYGQLHAEHRDFSERCRRAVWRPWVSIRNEPAPDQENQSAEPDGS